MAYTKLINGVRVALTEIEIAARQAEEALVASQEPERLASQIRQERNTLLSDCDWTQVSDAPVNQVAWQTYRQALRDVTSQEGFPYDVTWPTKPE
jgi:hypothetical protein